MGLGALTMALVMGCGWYATRIIPRVMNRAAANQGFAAGAAAASTSGAFSFAAPDAYKTLEGGFQGEMNRDEALLLLGFDPATENPSAKEIRDRYRRLMVTHHSDVDGSSLVAAKLNEAKAHLAPK